MILVGSSVWIDYFRGATTLKTETLERLLGVEPVLIGDLILAEVLQGFPNDRDFELARQRLLLLEVVDLGGQEVAIAVARNFRKLRGLGFTIRKTIDCFIATKCILSDYQLLHEDPDFDPFVKHLGLKVIG